MFGVIRTSMRTNPLGEIGIVFACLFPLLLLGLMLNCGPGAITAQQIQLCDEACRGLGLGVMKVDAADGDCFCGGYGPVRKIELAVETTIRGVAR